SAVHENNRSCERHRERSYRRSRPECHCRTGIDEADFARRCLDHGQLQGNSAPRDESRPARHGQSRCHGPRIQREGRQLRQCQRSSFQPATSRKCDGQLCEGGAAHPRQNRPQSWRKRPPATTWNVGSAEGLDSAMSAAASTFDNADAWRPAVNPWIIALAVTLATFMEAVFSPASRRYWRIRFLPPNVAWHSPSMASPS